MNNSSNIVPGFLGNSNSKNAQCSPSNGWCFTLNNYTDIEYSSIVSLLQENNDYNYCIGKEVGESGTPHLQGYIGLKDKKKKFRMTKFEKLCMRDGVKCIFNTRAKGSPIQNLDYCEKEDKACVTNIKRPKKIKIFEDWSKYPWALDLIKIIEEEPEDRVIYWLYGKQGGGKSAFMKYACIKHDAVLINGSAANMKNGIIEYEKKTGEYPTLIMNNMGFDTNMEKISYSGYEEIKDMLFYSGKYEGGMVVGNEPTMIIFANSPPITDNVKFKVICID